MRRILHFMIFLILFVSCKPDVEHPSFYGKEKNAYLAYQKDFTSNGLKWGYIDKSGQISIRLIYDDARDFQNGLAAVMSNGRWGCIDKNGNEVIPLRFQTINTNSDEYILAKDFLGKYHIYSTEGKVLRDSLNFQSLDQYKKGIGIGQKDQSFVFVDRNGEINSIHQYQELIRLTDTLFAAKLSGHFGLINHKEDVLLPFEQGKIYSPQNNLIRVKNDDKYLFYGLPTLDLKSGKYLHASDFNNGYAVISKGNSYALIDTNFLEAPLLYTNVEYGGQNYWIYQANDKFGFLHANGDLMTLPSFDMAMRFAEGMAGYALEDAWGYIDSNGEIVLEPILPLAWDYCEGLARFITPNGYGFLDKEGKIAIQAKYREVRDFHDGLARMAN